MDREPKQLRGQKTILHQVPCLALGLIGRLCLALGGSGVLLPPGACLGTPGTFLAVHGCTGVPSHFPSLSTNPKVGGSTLSSHPRHPLQFILNNKLFSYLCNLLCCVPALFNPRACKKLPYKKKLPCSVPSQVNDPPLSTR